MKKLIFKLLLALIPILLLFAFFVAYEPYDYWANKGFSTYNAKPISALRELKVRGEDGGVWLLGDSRMANLNVGMVEEASGEECIMLGFGGSTFPEALDTLEYAMGTLGRTPDKLVIGLSFYTANSNHHANRVNGAIEVVEDPLKFFGDFHYWYGAIEHLQIDASNLIADVTGIESIRQRYENPSALDQNLAPTETQYLNDARLDIYDYSNIIYGQVEEYGDLAPTFERIDRIVELCEERGVELEFILWPCNRTIWDRVIMPLDLYDEIELYKDYVKSRAKVYDMEFPHRDMAGQDGLFLDGFHLTLEGKSMIIDAVFGGTRYDWCVVTTPESYLASKE